MFQLYPRRLNRLVLQASLVSHTENPQCFTLQKKTQTKNPITRLKDKFESFYRATKWNELERSPGVIYPGLSSHRAAKGEVSDKLWAGRRLYWFYIKTSLAPRPVVHCLPTIKHNDINFRKLKAVGNLRNIFKVFSNSFQVKKKKRS